MSSYVVMAKRFGEFIAQGQYGAAHAFLTDEAGVAQTPADLKAAVERMTKYEPICEVRVMEEFILEDWPEKRDSDVAVVYVALNGEEFCEAVTLTIVEGGNGFRIRQLEWGRP